MRPVLPAAEVTLGNQKREEKKKRGKLQKHKRRKLYQERSQKGEKRTEREQKGK